MKSIKRLLHSYRVWTDKLTGYQIFTLIVNLVTLLSVWLIYITTK